METQIEEIQSTRSLRIPKISSVARDSDIIENLQYTSLKDIKCNTPTRYYLTLYEENDFNSTLAIRNELVKRATSVYLQSAAFIYKIMSRKSSQDNDYVARGYWL
ncbi:hypothetical protein JHK87_012650 [Glycine soja]|nr:hypothetical protein JHK87_012650 [Glycine soja]